MKFKSDPTTLTRRDHFAMAALTGLLSSGDIDIKQTITGLDLSGAVAMLAYEFASAMEVARNKEGEA